MWYISWQWRKLAKRCACSCSTRNHRSQAGPMLARAGINVATIQQCWARSMGKGWKVSYLSNYQIISNYLHNLSIKRDFNNSPPPCHWSHRSTRFRSQKISALHYLWLLGEMDKELLILFNCKNQVWDWLGLPKHLGLKRERSEMGQIWKGTVAL